MENLCAFYRVQKPRTPSFYYQKLIIGVRIRNIQISCIFLLLTGNFISIGLTLVIHLPINAVYLSASLSSIRVLA